MREETSVDAVAAEYVSASRSLSDPVRQFRVRFLDQSGRVIGRLPMAAADTDAAGITAVLLDACSDVCAWAELWSGVAPVAYATEFTGRPTRDEMSATAQRIVVDREIALRDSRTLIAESRRLLAELDRWSDDDGEGHPAP